MYRKKGQRRILEFGSNRTRFNEFIKDIRADVIFDAEDINPIHKDYLLTQADDVYICDVREIHDKKYDLIFSTFTWGHITEPKKTFKHLLDMLNPDGSIFILSPRYDFPLYLNPAACHLPLFKRMLIAIRIVWSRALVILGGEPIFLIQLDPAVFHLPWRKDIDAVHWVSLWDLKRYLPKNVKLVRLHMNFPVLKGWFWKKFLLMAIQVEKNVSK